MATKVKAGEVFYVEEILDDKVFIGKMHYLVKWHGYSDRDSTWEPEENMEGCPDLVEKYYEKKEAFDKLKQEDPRIASEFEAPTASKNVIIDPTLPKRPMGFQRGLQAEAILSATECGGELCFLMKWKDSMVADIVSAREANIKCPQTVIKFYEGKITFH